MSCKSCEETQEAGFIAYYRVDKANVAISGCGEHVRKVFEAMERGEINKPTQPTNSIDSELEFDIKHFHTMAIGNLVTRNNGGQTQNEYLAEIEKLLSELIAKIHAKYVSRKEIEEAIEQQLEAAQENLQYQEEITKNDRLIREWRGTVFGVESCLKAVRAKLLPPTKGGNE